MKTYYKKIEALAFFLVIWIILNGNLRPNTLIIGVFLSIGTLILTNKLIGFDYADEFYEPPYAFLEFFVKLMWNVYKGCFDIFKRIITGKVDPSFVVYESKFQTELSLSLLSNSVTLVPGTIVYERMGNKLWVLAIDSDDETTLSEIATMEKILDKMERKRK